jgi:predicted 3-demethylubiquinone-9 3-methyltransferase (glyoxalase superfamily)
MRVNTNTIYFSDDGVKIVLEASTIQLTLEQFAVIKKDIEEKRQEKSMTWLRDKFKISLMLAVHVFNRIQVMLMFPDEHVRHITVEEYNQILVIPDELSELDKNQPI